MATWRSSPGTTTRLVRRTPSRAGCCRSLPADSEPARDIAPFYGTRELADNPSKYPGGMSMLRAVIAALSFVLFALAPASAQDWPARTINVVVPIGGRSGTDILPRVAL